LRSIKRFGNSGIGTVGDLVYSVALDDFLVDGNAQARGLRGVDVAISQFEALMGEVVTERGVGHAELEHLTTGNGGQGVQRSRDRDS
jgi:hypothetical protein